MTARLDNHIGRITLPQAYDYMNLPRRKILDDGPVRHMVYGTIHQLALIEKFISGIEKDRYVLVRFEDLISKPSIELQKLSDRLDLHPVALRALTQIDPERAKNSEQFFQRSTVSNTKKLLAKTRKRWGYGSVWSKFFSNI
jgi:hypothetical protein